MVRELGLSGRIVVWPMEVVKVGSTTRRAVAPSVTPRTMPVHCDVMSCAVSPVTATVGLPRAAASGREFGILSGLYTAKYFCRKAFVTRREQDIAYQMGGLRVASELVTEK